MIYNVLVNFYGHSIMSEAFKTSQESYIVKADNKPQAEYKVRTIIRRTWNFPVFKIINVSKMPKNANIPVNKEIIDEIPRWLS